MSLSQEIKEKAKDLYELSHKVEYEEYLDTEVWKSDGLCVIPYMSKLKCGADVHYVTNGDWSFHIKDGKMIMHTPCGFEESNLDEFKVMRIRDFSAQEAARNYLEVLTYEQFLLKVKRDYYFDDDIAF